MFTKLPKVAAVLFALQGVSIGALYYGLYHKHQTLDGCHARLARMQTIRTQLADISGKLDKTEARIAAAEAQRDHGKR